eukprot:1179577-Prorocentrum_minimum.AAC.6
MSLLGDVDLLALASQSEGFTGAELEHLCREAALAALREDLDAAGVAQAHFLKVGSVSELADTNPMNPMNHTSS